MDYSYVDIDMLDKELLKEEQEEVNEKDNYKTRVQEMSQKQGVELSFPNNISKSRKNDPKRVLNKVHEFFL